jgi:hypothetical protein
MLFMLLQNGKTKRPRRQSMPASLPAPPRATIRAKPSPEPYLPNDLGMIVPRQWADLHRRCRPCDSPEGQLMLAVLAQALVDYREGNLLERRSAKNWFSRRGEGFDFTCELLGVDPDRARKSILSAASTMASDAEPVRERRTA